MLPQPLEPGVDAYIEYDPKPNGMIGVTGITIRFEILQ